MADPETLHKLKKYKAYLESNPNGDKVLLVLNKVSVLPVSMLVLKETGLGKLVNGFRKHGGEIGIRAKELVSKWKSLVAEEASTSQKKTHSKRYSSPPRSPSRSPDDKRYSSPPRSPSRSPDDKRYSSSPRSPSRSPDDKRYSSRLRSPSRSPDDTRYRSPPRSLSRSQDDTRYRSPPRSPSRSASPASYRSRSGSPASRRSYSPAGSPDRSPSPHAKAYSRSGSESDSGYRHRQPDEEEEEEEESPPVKRKSAFIMSDEEDSDEDEEEDYDSGENKFVVSDEEMSGEYESPPRRKRQYSECDNDSPERGTKHKYPERSKPDQRYRDSSGKSVARDSTKYRHSDSGYKAKAAERHSSSRSCDDSSSHRHREEVVKHRKEEYEARKERVKDKMRSYDDRDRVKSGELKFSNKHATNSTPAEKILKEHSSRNGVHTHSKHSDTKQSGELVKYQHTEAASSGSRESSKKHQKDSRSSHHSHSSKPGDSSFSRHGESKRSHSSESGSLKYVDSGKLCHSKLNSDRHHTKSQSRNLETSPSGKSSHRVSHPGSEKTKPSSDHRRSHAVDCNSAERKVSNTPKQNKALSPADFNRTKHQDHPRSSLAECASSKSKVGETFKKASKDQPSSSGKTHSDKTPSTSKGSGYKGREQSSSSDKSGKVADFKASSSSKSSKHSGQNDSSPNKTERDFQKKKSKPVPHHSESVFDLFSVDKTEKVLPVSERNPVSPRPEKSRVSSKAHQHASKTEHVTESRHQGSKHSSKEKGRGSADRSSKTETLLDINSASDRQSKTQNKKGSHDKRHVKSDSKSDSKKTEKRKPELSEEGMSFTDFMNCDTSVGAKRPKPSSSPAEQKTNYDKFKVKKSSGQPVKRDEIPVLEPQPGPSHSVPQPAKSVKITEEDILSYLPETHAHYRPWRFSDVDKKQDSEIDLAKIGFKSNTRTQVYSGRKHAITEMKSLFDLSMQVLIDNIDAIDYVGGIPADILMPVLDRCSAQQLYRLEDLNAHFLVDTDELWQRHCQREFRKSQPDEMETWREMYLRLLDEREAKYERLKGRMSKTVKHLDHTAKKTKLAYVDCVVKPPREVKRQQMKYGTATVSTAPNKGNVDMSWSRSKAPMATRPIPLPSRPIKRSAPMMEKTMKMMKKFHR